MIVIILLFLLKFDLFFFFFKKSSFIFNFNLIKTLKFINFITPPTLDNAAFTTNYYVNVPRVKLNSVL